MSSSAFALPAQLAAKADPALTAADDAHLAVIARTLEESVASLERQIATLLQETDRAGQGAMDRDLEVHRLSGRVRTLRRHGLDLCLGRLVPDDGGPPVYVGRLGLTGSDGERLLVDWRTPAAEPFFGATHARPMGLASRRRFRWTRGRISDYWDEVFTPGALEGHAALDDQSAFVASLGSSRSSQMRDVLGTIQADQDAIIRAGSRGALVVDGGPGTGKTVVALHRTAYLLHADPRLHRSRGGVLVVGPHQPYLAYVADVLPSLGEEGVQTCTIADLVTEGGAARPDADPEVARLKASLALVAALQPAVRWYEEPPTEPLVVATDAGDLTVTAAAWAEAFDAPDPGTPHNEGRGVVWEALLDLLTDQVEPPLPDEDDAPDLVDPVPGIRRSLVHDRGLLSAFNRAWPLLEAADLVGDLWSVPAFLRMCAPSLTPDEVRALQRAEPQAWTTSDLPLLDAARHLLGDPEAVRRRRRQVAAAAAERERMDRIADDLVDSDDDGEGAITMLRGEDVRDALVDQDHVSRLDPDLLAGPFAHVVVDEAQELTDAQWQMLLRRCPSRSLTVVGDRAQARHGFAETWEQRLARLGLTEVTVSSLAINYRTPQEVMVEAEPVIRAVLPDANVPTSVRSTGLPVVHGSVGDLASVLSTWLDAHAEGRACVIAAPDTDVLLPPSTRVRALTPELAKGLEFDLVVLLDPERFGTGIEGAVDRYVAMTRATQQLVVLTGG